MEENKNSKSKLLMGLVGGLIIGFAISTIGARVYIDNYKSTTNVTTKEDKLDNNKKEIEYLDVLDDIVQTNFNKLMEASGYYGGTQEEYFKSSKISNNDIQNTLAFATVAASGKMKDGMTEEEFEELLKEYFGDDYKYTHGPISGKMCAPFYYDEASKTYKAGKTEGCGGSSGPHYILTRITKAEKQDKELTLSISVMFPGKYDDLTDAGYMKYYKDAAKTKELTNLTFILAAHSDESIPKMSDTNFKNAGKYKFVLKEVKDGVYSFVSSEPIE